MMLARHADPMETSCPLAVLRLLWQVDAAGGDGKGRLLGAESGGHEECQRSQCERNNQRAYRIATSHFQFLPETADGPRIEHIERRRQ